MKTIKLSPRQKEVLGLLAQGWTAWGCAKTNAVHIQGKWVCNVDTMAVLERIGFARATDRWRGWVVTEEGKKYHATNA